MNNVLTEYWVWMQAALGAGARVAGLLSYYKTPEQVYNALCLGDLQSLIEPAMRRRLSSISPSQVYPIMKACEQNGWRIVTPDSAYYPRAFHQLDNMPLALYVNGDVSLLQKQPAIAFVGTRKASVYGKKAAERLSFSVAAAGAVVVSGCALGIDSHAHLGALEAAGKTIGFLGSPLDADYPKNNRSLRAAIARNGALVSEYPPGSVVTKANFPIRNRLIAAATLGTVVVEADPKSGALITANYAMEFGRDVFAVPGEITDSAFMGGNNLIRDGAKPVFSAMDILEEYAYDYDAVLNTEKVKLPLDLSLRAAIMAAEPIACMQSPVPSEQKKVMPAKKKGTAQPEGGSLVKKKEALRQNQDATAQKNVNIQKNSSLKEKELPAYIDNAGRKIYDFIKENGASEVDQLAMCLHLTAAQVLSGLTMLELAGIVGKGKRNLYEIK